MTDTFPAALTRCDLDLLGRRRGDLPGIGHRQHQRHVDLPVGGTQRSPSPARSPPAATGSLANTATVSVGAGVTDPAPGNNTATDTDTLTPTADLSITKTDGAATDGAGRR